MADDAIRMDLAFFNGKKGTLKLTTRSLEFKSWKGESFSLSIGGINDVSFHKTATTTSTLYINKMEIIVCRAHLWAADIKKLSVPSV